MYDASMLLGMTQIGDPSWNTDQGVEHICKYKSGKLVCVVKAEMDKIVLPWPTDEFELEHFCLNPKDGDLYLNWVKPGETLVEARSDTDVQIVRRIWV